MFFWYFLGFCFYIFSSGFSFFPIFLTHGYNGFDSGALAVLVLFFECF